MLDPNFSAWMITAANEPHVIDTGPQSEVAKYILAGSAHLELEIRNRELLAEDRAGCRQLGGHPAHGGIEAKARLDTHNHQVQRIGQAQKDRLKPLFLPAVHDQAWQVETNSTAHCRDRERIARQAELECHDRKGDRQAQEHED